MAPNSRGGPPSWARGLEQDDEQQSEGDGENREVEAGAADPVRKTGAVSRAEVEARGTGVIDPHDSFHRLGFPHNELRVLFTGVMFLTRLPVPKSIDHHPAYLMRAMAWFPLIGALVGAWGAVWFDAAATLWSVPVASAVSWLSTVWLTGCFHEDGLADSLDAFGGGWGRQQILRIMQDSCVGSYALMGVCLASYAKLGLLASLPAADVASITIAAHAVSRWAAILLVYACRYVEDDGAKRAMYGTLAYHKPLLTSGRVAWASACAFAAVGLLPVLYSRRIVDFGVRC